MQLFNSINSNMVLFVKKNECILNVSLDKYIFLSEVAIVDNLQSIVMFVVFPHWYTYAFVSEWSPYTRL